MSRQSSFLNFLGDVPTADKLKTEHNITLVDRTKPAEEPSRANGEDGDAERNDSEVTPTSGTGTPLFKRLTNNSQTFSQSVRQQVAKQKYARYGQDRYGGDDDDTTHNSSSLHPPDDASANAPQPGEPANPTQTSYLDRSRAKASALIKRKCTGLGRGKETRDTVIDVLYENQRGFFFFGIPRYSASSLLPSDPRPWQNAQFRTSPVDIRNSQVPDPSWEWVWKSWYVDMSRDVDEEGWEYSLLFKAGHNWHGNHPWFHSFVRRRRWLRMRRRRDAKQASKDKAHELTPEYFTIHPSTLKPSSDEMSKARTSEVARMHARMEDEPAIEKMDITDIGSLIRALRKAAVDREKLVAVRKFVASGGDELYYLSQRMDVIMSLFIYQSSRRQLLADLIAHHDSAHERRESLKEHSHAADDDAVQKEHNVAVKQAELIHDAVIAAEEQVQKLEYWSDIKGMANEGATPHPGRWLDVEAGEGGHPEEAFASKQDSSERAHKPHAHPEHDEGPKDESGAPSKKSSVWFDTQTSPDNDKRLGKSPDSSEDTNSLGRYTTAAESAWGVSTNSKALSPAQKGKEKAARLLSLDGMMEENEETAYEHDEHPEPKESEEVAGDDTPAVPASTEQSDLPVVSPEPDEGDVVEKQNA